MARYAVWFKDGYWYCADMKLCDTRCSKNKENLISNLSFITMNGGCWYYGE